MNTLVLEIINKEVPYKGYYNPAPEGFRFRYRSMKTRDNAFKKLIKTINKSDFIQSYRIMEYEGIYEYYKPCELIGEYKEDDLCDMGLI